MDEQERVARLGGWWAETKPILLLILLAVALRAWQLTHTEVTSRDSLSYIRLAWRFEHESWPTVLRSSTQHPGYPLSILAISGPVRAAFPDDLAFAMQLSAQLASALASVLLVVPMFLLGRELFDRRVCFGAVLLLQCLPSTGRLMGDGLSEPLFLLCAATALLMAAHGLRRATPGWFVACGVAAALAYLTRPEGLLLIGVAGLVLVVLFLLGRWAAGVRNCLWCGAGLAVTALLLALPFIWTVGGISNKPTATQLLEERQGSAGPVLKSNELWAVWMPGWQQNGPADWGWALNAFAAELARGFFYVFWVPALLGLWWFRDRLGKPAAWLLLLTATVLFLVLYRVAAHMGYISDRHAVLIVFAGCYWTSAALLALGETLAARWKTVRSPACGMILLLLCCAVPLVKTLEDLHADRQGFREAGYWLADHARPDDQIIDPYCWAGYYAGGAFRDRPENTHSGMGYVVIERGSSRHSHLKEVAEAIALAEKRGRLVRSFKVPRGEVAVYAVPVR